MRCAARSFELSSKITDMSNKRAELTSPQSAWIDFRRQNLTSVDVRFWRLKSVPADVIGRVMCQFGAFLYNLSRISVIWWNQPGRLGFKLTYYTPSTRHWYINPLTAKLFNLNFHPLEVVSRWRDPQLQVSENYSDLTKWRSTVFKYCSLMSHFIFNMFKRWYLMC